MTIGNLDKTAIPEARCQNCKFARRNSYAAREEYFCVWLPPKMFLVPTFNKMTGKPEAVWQSVYPQNPPDWECGQWKALEEPKRLVSSLPESVKQKIASAEAGELVPLTKKESAAMKLNASTLVKE